MIPKKLIAGNPFSFSVDPFKDVEGRDIAPPAWTSKISFRGNGNVLDVVADENWSFTISAADSLTLKAGKVYYQINALNAETDEVILIRSGQIDVTANFANQAGQYDPRTQNEKDLEQVRTLIRSLVDKGGVAEYRIGTRQLRRYDLKDLRELETTLAGRVAREKKSEAVANGDGDPHSLYVRFS